MPLEAKGTSKKTISKKHQAEMAQAGHPSAGGGATDSGPEVGAKIPKKKK